jgi:inosose dehydratase
MLIGTQQYGWFLYYQKENQDFTDHYDQIFAILNRVGVQAWEGNLDSEVGLQRLVEKLRAHNLPMPTVYTGGLLHDAGWPTTVDKILRRATIAQQAGAQIVSLNPDPKSWKTSSPKTGEELKIQVEAVQTLADKLRSNGLQLAYHYHNKELENSGREFHYMLNSVEENLLGLCLDVHWAYRGSGNSQPALMNLLKLYGRRALVLHLRQSRQGVWLESLGEGDVDYRPVAGYLKALEFDGPAIIELAYEAGTEITLPIEEAYRQSVAWIKQTFA